MEDRDFVVGGQGGLDDVAADESGAADEEDAHGSSLVGVGGEGADSRYLGWLWVKVKGEGKGGWGRELVEGPPCAFGWRFGFLEGKGAWDSGVGVPARPVVH